MATKSIETNENKTVTSLPAYLTPPVRELGYIARSAYKTKSYILRVLRRQHVFPYKRSKFIKAGDRVRFQEALTMAYIAKNTTIRVPRVLDVFTIRGAVYIVQEYIDGPVLEDVWRHLSPEEQRSSMAQLKDCLDQLRALEPPCPGHVQAVDGGGLIDDRLQKGVWGPFDNHATFHWFLTHDALRACYERYPDVQEALAKVYQKPYKTMFSHGDLGPHNILWKDGRIVVIDWERSGWFPEYWDYTRVHAARGRMKGWWTMFQETVDDRYDDEVELAIRISEYFVTL